MTKRVADFEIDQSPIDVLQWSDNKSNIDTLLRKKEQWFRENVTGFWDDWYRDVMNIDTASKFGIQLWGQILGISLDIYIDPVENSPLFGFKIAGDYQPFANYDHGNFTALEGITTTLTLEDARLLIRLRYLKITTRPSVYYINRMLAEAFGVGKAYVLDSHDMQYAIYVFKREPGTRLRLMIDYFDLLPRPSTVGVEIRVGERRPFGFEVPGLATDKQPFANYNKGTFIEDRS